MKNFLFISINDHIPWGGSEELWHKLALNLSRSSRVAVLVKKWPKTPKQILELEEKKIKVFYKRESSSKKISMVKNIFQIQYNHKTKYSWYSSIPDLKIFNLIVISLGNNIEPQLPSFTDYLKEHNIPYVIIVQLATDLRMVNDKLLLDLARSFTQAQRVFFLSKENAVKMEISLGCKLANKDYCCNPFDYEQKYLPYFNKIEQYYSLACVASLNSFHKAQDLLITALGQDKWKNRNIYLNLFGDGINKEQLQRLIILYGLEDKVKINGFVENKNSIWEKNLVCIMPSRMEGQSLAMLEAMSYGRMVISTKVGDAERLIKNGETGYLIDFPTIKSIDMTLEEAWSHKKNWEFMGKQSRKKLFKIIGLDPVIDLSEKLQALI